MPPRTWLLVTYAPPYLITYNICPPGNGGVLHEEPRGKKKVTLAYFECLYYPFVCTYPVWKNRTHIFELGTHPVWKPKGARKKNARTPRIELTRVGCTKDWRIVYGPTHWSHRLIPFSSTSAERSWTGIGISTFLRACTARDREITAFDTRVFAICKILLGWKTYKYYYEIIELPNPRPTQPKKKYVMSGIWAPFSQSK